MFQRCWSGSRPLKAEASSFHVAAACTPPVTTPKVMWVESSQWWVIGASRIVHPGEPVHEGRRPSAGSPGQAGVDEARCRAPTGRGCRWPTAP